MLKYLMIPYMAISSRLHGAGSFTGCRPISQVMLSAPYAYAVFSQTGNWYYALITLALTYLGYTTGNADGFVDFVRNNPPISNIAIFIADRFGIDRNTRTYDSIFWSVKGLVIALPAAIFLPFNTGYVLYLVLSVVSWPLAYLFEGRHIFDGDTEYFTGLGTGLALTMVM